VNGRAVIGLFFLAAAALLWMVTPAHVTWGNHHYLKHIAIYSLAGLGALFLVVGRRR
jgi:hypothetical protein